MIFADPDHLYHLKITNIGTACAYKLASSYLLIADCIICMHDAWAANACIFAVQTMALFQHLTFFEFEIDPAATRACHGLASWSFMLAIM